MDLLRTSKLPPSAVRVVYNGFNYPYSFMGKKEAEERLAKLGLDHVRPFLFHVGGNQWYKNRTAVMQIFKELVRDRAFADLDLVLAGAPWTDEMRRLVEDNDLKGRIHEILEPTEEDLRALYSSAVALLYPSLYEGFGWPIIEAQACGCPVFTTDRPPMTEVAADAAVYFDPKELGAAVAILRENLSSNAKMDSLRLKGYENCKRFSAGRMVEAYINLYKEVLG